MSRGRFAPDGTLSATQALRNRAEEFANRAATHQDLPTTKQQLRSHLNHIRDQYKLFGAPLGIHGPDLTGYSWYFAEIGADPKQALKLAKAILAMVSESQRAAA